MKNIFKRNLKIKNKGNKILKVFNFFIFLFCISMHVTSGQMNWHKYYFKNNHFSLQSPCELFQLPRLDASVLQLNNLIIVKKMKKPYFVYVISGPENIVTGLKDEIPIQQLPKLILNTLIGKMEIKDYESKDTLLTFKNNNCQGILTSGICYMTRGMYKGFTRRFKTLNVLKGKQYWLITINYDLNDSFQERMAERLMNSFQILD